MTKLKEYKYVLGKISICNESNESKRKEKRKKERLENIQANPSNSENEAPIQQASNIHFARVFLSPPFFFYNNKSNQSTFTLQHYLLNPKTNVRFQMN